MRALIHDPDAPRGLRLADDVPAPEPAPDEALVRVAAVSLNFGELDLVGGNPPGQVVGRDSAGTVLRAAADGSGPPAGTRVASFAPGGGAWAQLQAVPGRDLAVLPDGVEPGAVAALPSAGVSALRAVRRLGAVLGRRVLVTGASGGVGRYAVQLAALAGADVVASVGAPERGRGLRELGAAQVVVGLDGVDEPVHGVLDNVGGPLLADALDLVAEHGVVQQIGAASGEPTVLNLAHKLVNRRLELFVVGTGLTTGDARFAFGPDLAYLARLLGEGRLDAQIGWRGPWERAVEGADALFGRRVAGKVVLDVT
ncbi:zinc-binding dehydrogenase [Streptomyces avicenniae]|uniref:zinc-binding dehydrogenase n=1 Tax=Streptomyces avicenniae TaxID=500153 RepID=UPI00069A8733|nr:zinc-binding dehydrogenase [Streptomyces avicenniae]